MLDTSSGRIFPASKRGHTETESFRSCNTSFLNDETLAGDKTIGRYMEEDTIMVLLPTVGAIRVDNKTLLEAGEVYVSYLQKGTTITISNPYEKELVNYLQLCFKNNTSAKEEPALYSFEMNGNCLTDLFAANMEGGMLFSSIGKFKGREETVYETYQPGNGVFVFVIQGAFEVQYRLLETRDGLALWDVEQIEIEALSNDAILLVIEMPDAKGGETFSPQY